MWASDGICGERVDVGRRCTRARERFPHHRIEVWVPQQGVERGQLRLWRVGRTRRDMTPQAGSDQFSSRKQICPMRGMILEFGCDLGEGVVYPTRQHPKGASHARGGRSTPHNTRPPSAAARLPPRCLCGPHPGMRSARLGDRPAASPRRRGEGQSAVPSPRTPPAPGRGPYGAGHDAG